MIRSATACAANRWTVCSSPDRHRQDRAAPCAARRAHQHRRQRAVMGRERPRLCIADVAQEPPSGVAHAPMSVWEMCWGACVVRVEMLPENPHDVSQHLLQQGTASLPRFCRGSPAGVAPNLPGVITSGLPSLRSPIFREHDGRVKGPLRRLRALDPPVALPMLLQLPERRHERFDSWLARRRRQDISGRPGAWRG